MRGHEGGRRIGLNGGAVTTAPAADMAQAKSVRQELSRVRESYNFRKIKNRETLIRCFCLSFFKWHLICIHRIRSKEIVHDSIPRDFGWR
jgi:hypothetical protein